MNEHIPYILTVNAGSSSIKFAAFETASLKKILEGTIDRIGMDGTYIRIVNFVTDNNSTTKVTDTDIHQLLITTIQTELSEYSLVAIGHRIAHSGGLYTGPTQITEDVITKLTDLTPLAPRHLPVEISLLKILREHFSTVQHYACFDTTFHKNLPRVAKMLPLPRTFESHGIQRYGFHGLSYEHLMNELENTYNEPITKQRIILLHLGSGASLSGVLNGTSVETSMGFTPTGGIPMGTRSGELDPGLFEYFLHNENQDIESFMHMVNFESGLLGISESTADMEVLLKIQNEDVRAAEAVTYFCYQVKKYIGALTTVLGGVDTIVFTGGMGEKSSEIRARILNNLEYLGIHVDTEANQSHRKIISQEDSSVKIYVIPTNEEHIIAKHIKEIHG